MMTDFQKITYVDNATRHEYEGLRRIADDKWFIENAVLRRYAGGEQIDLVTDALADCDRYKAALEEIQRLAAGEGSTEELMAIITYVHIAANKALKSQESEKGTR